MLPLQTSLNFSYTRKNALQRLIKSTVLIIAFFDFFNRITKKELVFGKESKSKTTFNNKRNVYGDEIG